MIFKSEQIDLLRKLVAERLSAKRFSHTLGVCRAAVMLAEFCGVDESEAEVAALLHDITKEYSNEAQLEIIGKAGIDLDIDDLLSPQIWHSYTAPFVIKRDFPEFATPNVLSATFNHTLGSQTMTDFDEIIFLADFIEDTRPYEASKNLRKFVLDRMTTGEIQKNIRVLHIASINSIDLTISHLTKTGRKINVKNILTKTALKSKI